MRTQGYLHLMRPINCTMMGFAVIVGAALARSSSIGSLDSSLIYGFITGFVLTGASMAINDYYDREIDAINEPGRPIPSGSVTPRQALALAGILTAVGFAAAYFTSILCLATAIIAWVVFVIYTTVGKRSGLPGNFLVSLCVIVPFIYGSVLAVSSIGLNVLFFASMAFLSNTGREITKGIVDVKGDRTQNVKTLAVRYGEKNAAVAAAIFYLGAVALSPAPWFLKLVSLWFIPPVAITDLGLIASSIILLRDHSRENARRVKTSVLAWFAMGLLGFILGTLK
jgi:geranylgeranylglycerol-phosphate geranylgeranyltransferase